MKKEITQIHKALLLMGLFTIISATTFAQNQNQLQEVHNETPDDAYVPVNKSAMERSPAYNVRNSTFFTSQVNVDSNGDNIVGDAANEPSIAVDPTNPNRIVIGWRQFDTTSNNFRQAGYGYSVDGGLTWTFPGVLNPGVFRSDPVLDFDADGNFYYNSLQGDFTCDVFTIDDGGVVWGPAVQAKGGDRQWMRVDHTTGASGGHNYSFWNSSFTTCSPGSFTRSTDGSDSFEDCVTIDGDPRWGTLAVDGDGILYAAGVSNLTGDVVVTKSTTARDASITPVTWDSFSVVDLDGFLTAGPPLNPSGLWGQYWVDVDASGGAGDGNVYVCSTVVRSSNSDPADVMFARSTDGGVTFEPPIRINTDASTSNHQWFGTMSVAPNGRIDVIWLDTRDAPGGTVDSVLYYTFSEDQGDTWASEEAISVAFDPTIGYPQQSKMGDYVDMVSDNNGAHLAWTNTINGGQDVYYTYITPDDLGIDDVATDFDFTTYPNPFTEEINIEFFMETEEHVTIEIFDITGKRVSTLLDKVTSGKQEIVWNGASLKSGLYFVSVETGTRREIAKVIRQ